jgi:IS5 family transposase
LIAGKQQRFDDYVQTTAKKRTNREKFLPDMDQVVPLRAVAELIEPHYPRSGSKG